MHWVAAASIVRQLVFAALIFLFIGPETPLVYIGVIECASVLAVTLFCMWVVKRMGHAIPHPILKLKLLLPPLIEAAPIGLTELAWAFMWYFATVLLGFCLPINRWDGSGPRTAF